MPFQLPGRFSTTTTTPSPALPLLVAGAGLAVVLAGVYLVPHLQTSVAPTPSAVVSAPPQPAPQPTTDTPAAIRDDLREHLELGEREMASSIEELARAEQEWTLLAGRLDPTYMPDSRRRATAAAAAAHETRDRLSRALDHMQIVVDHFK